MLKHLES
jgi:hypothetical protein